MVDACSWCPALSHRLLRTARSTLRARTAQSASSHNTRVDCQRVQLAVVCSAQTLRSCAVTALCPARVDRSSKAAPNTLPQCSESEWTKQDITQRSDWKRKEGSNTMSTAKERTIQFFVQRKSKEIPLVGVDSPWLAFATVPYKTIDQKQSTFDKFDCFDWDI